MKRSFRIVLAAASVVALAGCQRPAQRVSSGYDFSGEAPAYVSMGAGDRLGSVLLENRLYMARVNHENNVYATVDTESYGD